jgi:DNA-binding NarL/FixJ family response regulator
MTVRCLIVDDSEDFLRAGSRALEREGIDVVAVASTSTEALARADELKPDVALIDINLGDENGFDLAQQFAEAGIQTNVIVISTYAEDEFAEAAAATPTRGYLPKWLSGAVVRQLIEGGR